MFPYNTFSHLACFAYDAYFLESSDLPPNWLLFRTCPERYQRHGYFGKSYINIDHQKRAIKLVLAHRGTSNMDGIIEDAELWLLDIVPKQYEDGAKPFNDFVLEELIQNYPDYQIDAFYQTGHSLGATLTELLVAGGENENMKGACFETPGSIVLIQYYVSRGLLPKNALEYAQNNLASIKTSPDAINTGLRTAATKYNYTIEVPNTYPVPLDVLPLPFAPNLYYYVFDYSFKVKHPMLNIFNAFKENKPFKPVSQWPYGLWSGFVSYLNYDTNKPYWDGYINFLWDNNGFVSDMLRIIFLDDYNAFSDFYQTYLMLVYSLSKLGSFQQIPPPFFLLQEKMSLSEIWYKGQTDLQNYFQDFTHFSNYFLWYFSNPASTYLANSHSLPPSAPKGLTNPQPSAPPMDPWSGPQEMLLVSPPPMDFEPNFPEEMPPNLAPSAPPLTATEKLEWTLDAIEKKLIDIQTKFAHVKQAPQRKAAIGGLITLVNNFKNQPERPNPQTFLDLISQINKKIVETQVDHERKYNEIPFGKFFKGTTKSRTVRELDMILRCDEVASLVNELTQLGPKNFSYYG